MISGDRFVPDGMTFEDREPKSVASDVTTGFKPSEYVVPPLSNSWPAIEPFSLAGSSPLLSSSQR